MKCNVLCVTCHPSYVTNANSHSHRPPPANSIMIYHDISVCRVECCCCFWPRARSLFRAHKALKLDGAAPLITGPPQTGFTTLLWKKDIHIYKKYWYVTCETWHLTCDMWHMTCDIWHVTHDMWGKENLLSTFQLRRSSGLWGKVFWRNFHKGSLKYSINELVMEVFVEQPWLHRVC